MSQKTCVAGERSIQYNPLGAELPNCSLIDLQEDPGLLCVICESIVGAGVFIGTPLFPILEQELKIFDMNFRLHS